MKANRAGSASPAKKLDKNSKQSSLTIQVDDENEASKTKERPSVTKNVIETLQSQTNPMSIIRQDGEDIIPNDAKILTSHFAKGEDSPIQNMNYTS